MTDHSGPPGRDDRDVPPSDGPAGSAPPPPNPFDAAFQGEAWDATRRRRRSSRSSGGSSGRSGESSSADSGSSSRRRRSGSSRPESSGPASGGSESGRPESGRPGSGGSGSGGSGSGGSRRSDTDPARRRRGSARSRRLRHTRSVVVHVVLGVLGLGLAWIVVTGALAAYQLQQARSDLSGLRTQLTAGGSGIDARADSLALHAHRAAVLTRGPAWATLAAIPWVGDPVDTVRGITTQTSALADRAVPGLLAAADDVNPRTVYRNGTVDLAAVGRAAGPVHTAAQEVTSAGDAVGALPDSTWLPLVDTARSDLADQLGTLSSTLDTTDKALQVLPTMLGGDGRTRRYFVAFQNNAELRGTGGLPGAFAIVTATDGKVAFERFESDSLLNGAASGLDFGAAYNQHYANDSPYKEYIDSNVSPHFPYAAQIWAAMWRNVSGEQVDGAFTVDPGALSYLLAATGPATAPDGAKVTAQNVVALLQKDVYAQFPDSGETEQRKDYILGIAEAVEKKVLAGSGNSRGLLTGLGRGVSERRIVGWSSDPAVQAVLASAPIGGTIADTDQPYGMLFVNNGAAGKLDYYLDRSVRWERTGCGDTRAVTVTIEVTNTAPASGLPPYVTDRLDRPDYPTVPGQNRSLVDYVATRGAQLLGVTVDGQQSGAGVFDEQGHPTFETILELTPGQTRTVVLRLQEPAGTDPVTMVTQPGVTPTQVETDDRSCR